MSGPLTGPFFVSVVLNEVKDLVLVILSECSGPGFVVLNRVKDLVPGF